MVVAAARYDAARGVTRCVCDEFNARRVRDVDESSGACVALEDASAENEDVADGVVSCGYVESELGGRELVYATREGRFAAVSADGTREAVGDAAGGTLAFEVSPAGEACVAVSALGRVIVMTSEFEALSEGEVEPGGGAAACACAWRGDGRYFATCSVREEDGVTTMRVWDAEGEVEAVGEVGTATSGTPATLVGRGRAEPPPLAWQPRGALIACAGRGESDVSDRVVFYERNGLRRGDFAIPGENVEIASMRWSCDSARLAVVARFEDGSRAMQIWTRSNMHWYMKYETRYPASEGAVRVEWDQERGDVVRAYTEGGLFERFDFFWETVVSDRGTCAVVDGEAIALTPMFRAPIPPPMCAARAIFAAPVVACAFRPASTREDGERVVALLSTGELAQCTSVSGADWERTADEFADSERAATWSRWMDNEIPATTLANVARRGDQIAWIRDTHIAVLCVTEEAGMSEIIIIPVDGTDDGRTTRVTPRAVGTLVSSNGVVFALARDSSDVYALDFDDTARGGGADFDEARRMERSGTVPRDVDAKILYARGLDACERYADALGAAPGEPRGALITLDSRGRLRVGALLVAENVTSFATHVSGADGCAVTSAEESEAVATSARDPASWGPDDDAPSARVVYVTRDHRMYVAEIDDIITNGARDRRAADGDVGDDAHVGNWLAERSAADGARMGELALNSDLHRRMRRAMRPEAAKMAADASTRVVEEGAMVVACAPGSTSVVLQMPRGNLETVAPKALVLPACACALRAGRYADAYALAAKQRVDLNLIVDYGWPKFVSAAEDFVADVDSPDAVMELLEALTNDDVTAPGGIYEELARLYPPRANSGDEAEVVGDKVQATCSAIRAAVERRGVSERWELAILTSYASGDDPDLSTALRRVAVIRQRELDHAAANATLVSSPPPRGSRAVDAATALKHLLFLVGAPTLYAAALGTYDLALAYLVAQHAQMDPGEYVAELQRFQSMREHERRAEIACQLGRHGEAITECLLDEDVERAASIAAERKMFPHALAEAERLKRSDARKALLTKFAEHLSLGARHEDAAVARLAAGDAASALDSYRAGSCWQQALTLAGRLRLSAKDRRDIAEELCESLSLTDPLASARVAARHLRDVDRAVELFARAGAWREACETAHAHDRGDLMETTIVPMCAGAAEEHFETFKENKARADKYAARLRDLRKHRERAQKALSLEQTDWSAFGGRPNAGADFEGDFDDGASEAPTLASDMSAYTDRTGLTSAVSATSAASTVGGRKAKKKKDKKNKGSKGLRAGSPTEERDLALHVVALAPMDKTLEEIGELLELLVLFGHESDARALQRVVGECVDAYATATKDAETSLKELAELAREKGESTEPFQRGAPSQTALEWKWSLLRGN